MEREQRPASDCTGYWLVLEGFKPILMHKYDEDGPCPIHPKEN